MLRFEQNGLKTSDVTPEDVRKILGLPLVQERSVLFGKDRDGNWTRSDRHKALVDAETDQLFAIHSDQYRTVPHEEGILAVTEVAEQNPEYGALEWTVRSKDNFRRMMATGRFPDVEVEVRPGDSLNPTVEYLNSYDGSWGEKIMFGAFRLVCSNGMIVGERVLTQSVPHLGAERPEEFLVSFGKCLEQFSIQKEIWKGWVDRELSIAHVEDVVDSLKLTGKDRDEVLGAADEGQDLWTYFNVITALITHRMKNLDRQVRSWNRLNALSREW